MYNLKGNPILYPHQVAILKLFFASDFAKTFFLTGGTALAAFYLNHRESQDLDLFSMKPFDTLFLRNTMQEIALQTGAEMTTELRSQTYNEIFLENKEKNWSQKIDIIQEQPVHFGDIVQVDGIPVDSLINIATNKILAVYGRLEVKDYIDLYVIFTSTNLLFEDMFELAKKKDTGLSEFYFANVIADVDQFETIPRMKIPFNRQKFNDFFKELSHQMLLKLKP